MNNRRTKKQKIKSEKRNAEEMRIKELKRLRERAIELEKKISEQKLENFKQLNIRNLKMFKAVNNFIAPFVISTGITVGAFSLFGGGLPFYKDPIVKYKVYDLNYQTNGYVTMNEFYRTNRSFDDPLSSNELIIYTPWEYRDSKYIRYKREYEISTSTLDLFDAVLEEDYDYIKKNIKDYKEEVQVTNKIEETEGQDYFFNASLHMFDKEDTLIYSETDLKNIIITLVELVLGMGIGSLIAYFRDFEYLEEIREINSDYRNKTEVIKDMQKELEKTNEKILSLSRKNGGKINEK